MKVILNMPILLLLLCSSSFADAGEGDAARQAEDAVVVNTTETDPKPAGGELTEEEEALLEQASTNCVYWVGREIGEERRALLQQLVLVERELKFPKEARGILLAAACRESSYSPRAQGDCWHSWKSGTEKRCASIGLVQFAGWAKKGIRKWQARLGEDRSVAGDPRFDALASAYYWGERFMYNLQKVKARCEYKPWQWKNKTNSELYGTRMHRYVAAANASAVRFPKCGKYLYSKKTKKVHCVDWIPRCMDTTLHFREMKKWQTEIEKGADAPIVGQGD